MRYGLFAASQESLQLVIREKERVERALGSAVRQGAGIRAELEEIEIGRMYVPREQF